LFLVSSQSPGLWAETSVDPTIKERMAALDGFLERQAAAIREGLPSARVVKFTRANHYVYLSNEAEVLREIRAFAARLR
jgi:pimeloyl-ACP methyl ester carboxylesterase